MLTDVLIPVAIFGGYLIIAAAVLGVFMTLEAYKLRRDRKSTPAKRRRALEDAFEGATIIAAGWPIFALIAVVVGPLILLAHAASWVEDKVVGMLSKWATPHDQEHRDAHAPVTGVRGEET